MGGRTIASSGITANPVNVKDPTRRFGSASYTVDEGATINVSVKLNHPSSHRIRTEIKVTPGTDQSVTFANRSISETFPYTAPEDPDCDDETVKLSFGTLPSNVSTGGSPDEATITIKDDEVCVSFGSSTYTVDEGDSVNVAVKLTKAPGRSVTIPVIVSPGPDTSVSFSRTSITGTFPYTAPQDRDSDDETVNLSFGTLPAGVVKGTPSTPTINIRDDDEPNVPPTFDEGMDTTRSVAENTASNTNIGNPVGATDVDNDTLTYSLSGTDAGSFGFNSSSGQIRTSTSLDFETKSSYSVTVNVDDGNDGTDSIRVTINVTDVNERPGKPAAPTVTGNGETSLNVAWSAPTNTGPPINDYDVQYRVGSSGPFTDADYDGTDTHTTISNLNPGTAYEVQVRAKSPEGTSAWSDSGTESTDTPALPTITIARDDASVTEGEDVEFILTASRASAETLTVEVSVTETGSFITGTTPTEVEFAGGETTAQLTVETVNDDVDEANGTVKATIDLDTGYTVGNPSSATVTVEDDDEPNVPPSFDEGMDTTRSVAENTASNTNIGNPVTATDADMDTLAYSLSGTDASSFTIVGTSSPTETGGQIRTSAALNFESKNSYSVTVTADDGQGGSATIDVTINVTDVNEAPVGKTIADRTLASGVLSREIDLSSYFSDPDTNDTLRYSASSSDTNVVTTSLSGSMLTLRRASAGSVTITATAADRPPGDGGRLTVSQEFTVTVETAVPDKPANLKAEPMIGGRGVELKWDAVDGAAGYEVEISPTTSTHQIDVTGLSAEITGLTPRTIYTLKVIACDPCGTSGLFSLPSELVDFEAPEPSSFGHPTRRGHQSDHAVKYVIGNIGNSVISDAIMPAVSAWNFAISRLGKGLNICANTDANCVNPDGFTVTIKTVIKNNRGVVFPLKTDEGCGKSRACVKVVKTPGGDHMERIHMIFEDPPWFAQKDKHGKWQHTEFVWTKDKHKNLGIVPCPYDPAYCGTIPTRKYVYVDRIMLHEFGHTLGLPDFYKDTTTGLNGSLNGVLLPNAAILKSAVMDTGFVINGEDLEQLRAIYLLHNPH